MDEVKEYRNVRLYDPMPIQPDLYVLRITNAQTIKPKSVNSPSELKGYYDWNFQTGEWQINPDPSAPKEQGPTFMFIHKDDMKVLAKQLKAKGLCE